MLSVVLLIPEKPVKIQLDAVAARGQTDALLLSASQRVILLCVLLDSLPLHSAWWANWPCPGAVHYYNAAQILSKASIALQHIMDMLISPNAQTLLLHV